MIAIESNTLYFGEYMQNNTTVATKDALKQKMLSNLEEARRQLKLKKKQVAEQWNQQSTESFDDDTIITRYSELTNGHDRGIQFFLLEFSHRKEILYSILQLDDKLQRNIEEFIRATLDSTPLILAGFEWNLNEEKVNSIKRLIRSHKNRTVTLVLLDKEESLLPFAFSKFDNFTAHAVQSIEEGKTKIQDLAKKDVIVLSMHQFVDFEKWCVMKFNTEDHLVFWNSQIGQSMDDLPNTYPFAKPVIDKKISDLPIDFDIKTLRNCKLFDHCTLLHPNPTQERYYRDLYYRDLGDLPMSDAPSDPFERYQMILDLANEEFASTHSFFQRRKWSDELGFEAMYLDHEKDEIEWINILNQYWRHFDRKIVNVSSDTLLEQKERAARREHSGIYFCDGDIHIINQANDDLPKHEKVHHYDISAKTPAIISLWDILKDWDEEQYEQDPLAEAAIQELQKDGYSQQVLISARDAIHHNISRNWTKSTKSVSSSEVKKIFDFSVPKLEYVWRDCDEAGKQPMIIQCKGLGLPNKTLKRTIFNVDLPMQAVRYSIQAVRYCDSQFSCLNIPAEPTELPKDFVNKWLDVVDSNEHSNSSVQLEASDLTFDEGDLQELNQTVTVFWLAMHRALRENEWVHNRHMGCSLLRFDQSRYVKFTEFVSKIVTQKPEIGMRLADLNLDLAKNSSVKCQTSNLCLEIRHNKKVIQLELLQSPFLSGF